MWFFNKRFAAGDISCARTHSRKNFTRRIAISVKNYCCSGNLFNRVPTACLEEAEMSVRAWFTEIYSKTINLA